MPSTLSKIGATIAEKIPPSWIMFLLQLSTAQRYLILGGLVVTLAGLRECYRSKQQKNRPKSKGPSVNLEFLKQMRFLLKIMIPSVWSKQVGILIMHTGTLIMRTFLSIYVAKLEGKVVGSVVQRNVSQFFTLLGKWLLIAVPACICNSSIRYLEKHLALSLRTQLVKEGYKAYFDNQLYYRVGNLDTRIPNPDHSLTEDITEFTTSVAHLYSHITKPLLDALLISVTLLQRAKKIGSNMFYGPVITLSVIGVTGEFLKAISPKFGAMVADEADLKAKLRHCHSRIVTNSEEIAFYGGGKVEKKVLEDSFIKEVRQSKKLYLAKLWYVFFEQYLMKYVWAGAGMCVTAIPILTAIGLKGKVDEGARTEYYMTTKNLLLSGGDAIQRLMTSYKEIVELAGYSSRVANMFKVFQEVSQGTYVRESCLKEQLRLGVIEENNNSIIELRKIKVVTPTGDIIIPELDLSIKPAMHVLITGPNGCGKSSLFRILSGLWPVFGEYLTRPPVNRLFYIPQRPYMSLGNLREQVIYPDTQADMKRKGISDADLAEILEKVRLNHIVAREGGWDSIRDWQDVLSGGEKQRVGVARLFYHKPNYALLDECTSAVSIDVEDSMYSMLIEEGITLMTITHRPTLFKHHTHVLRFSGEGTWTFDTMDFTKEV